MAAAIAVVTERGTADIPVSDLAEAADVSRRLVYQQFRDLDTLLLEAALDLARRELLPQVLDTASDSRARTLALARHMATHRGFYRALLTGSCSFAITKAFNDLFLPVNRQVARLINSDEDPEDLAAFITGGWGHFINSWVVDGPEPLDPDAFADRLLRAAAILLSPYLEGHPHD